MTRKLTYTNYSIKLEKRFSIEHEKNPNTNVLADQDFTLSAVWYHSHPESQHIIHIYHEIYENTFTCKDYLGLGVIMFKNVFSIFLCLMQKWPC